MTKAKRLERRIKDYRSKKVIFLSHCILNENTRYLGGAFRGGCVKEIIQECLDNDWGMVQMPCPEQYAWGGVTKRFLIMAYGTKGTLLYLARGLLLPMFLIYTKLAYRRLAKAAADQVGDYLNSGHSVIGVIGINGSPSCGVTTTLDFGKAFELTAGINVDTVNAEEMNNIIRQCATNGRGLFTAVLQERLKTRGMEVPYRAYDLTAEIDGRPYSAVTPWSS
jgi:predicted secreted protein